MCPHLVLVLAEGLEDVGLAGEVSVGVLQTLQQPLLQDQNRHSELVPQQLHGSEPTTTTAVDDAASCVWVCGFL